MKEIDFDNFFNSKLASNSSISAIRHREVVDALKGEVYHKPTTRADAQAMAAANQLQENRWYYIQDANGGTSRIYIMALTGMTFGGVATDVMQPNKSFNYDIGTDTLTELTAGQTVWTATNW